MSDQKHGAPISAVEFARMSNAYDKKHPGQTKSILFSRDVLQQYLTKPNIRVYFGLDEEDRLTVIFKPEGGDLKELSTNEEFLNKGKLCPPYCD